ncbi:hypothetical protein ACKWTF_004704 [Chironomus riparius]
MKLSILILTVITACVHAQGGWSQVGYQYENLARSILKTEFNGNKWNRNYPQTNKQLRFNPQNDWDRNFAHDDIGLMLDQNDFSNNFDKRSSHDDFYTHQEIEDIKHRFERFRRAFDKFSKRFLEMLSRIQEHSYKRTGFINQGQNEPDVDFWPMTDRVSW